MSTSAVLTITSAYIAKDHKVDGCPRKQLVRARLTTLEEQETPLSENLLEN